MESDSEIKHRDGETRPPNYVLMLCALCKERLDRQRLQDADITGVAILILKHTY
jgi:hypothetical protein